MCGLAGMLLFPTNRPDGFWQEIRHLFTQMFVFNEERGRDASGVSVIHRDGTFGLFKQPVPASELVMTAPYRSIMASIGPQTTCLLGYSRLPTKGSRWDNANNHPLRTRWVLGVHNGHIPNDDELFDHMALPREGKVDSEVIFRLLDRVSPASQNGSYLAAVQRQALQLRGRFATLSVDLRRPTWLVALNNGMPMCVHYHEPWQALCFSSRYLFLRKAFGRAVITEALPTERAYLFDAYQLLQQGKQPVGELPLTNAKAQGER